MKPACCVARALRPRQRRMPHRLRNSSGLWLARCTSSGSRASRRTRTRAQAPEKISHGGDGELKQPAYITCYRSWERLVGHHALTDVLSTWRVASQPRARTRLRRGGRTHAIRHAARATLCAQLAPSSGGRGRHRRNDRILTGIGARRGSAVAHPATQNYRELGAGHRRDSYAGVRGHGPRRPTQARPGTPARPALFEISRQTG